METIKQVLLENFPTHTIQHNEKNQEIVLSANCNTKNDWSVFVMQRKGSHFKKKLVELIKLCAIAEMNNQKVLIAANKSIEKQLLKGLKAWRVDARVVFF